MINNNSLTPKFVEKKEIQELSPIKNYKNVRLTNIELQSNVLRTRQLATDISNISSPDIQKKLKNCSIRNIIENVNDEHLIEELLIDLSSLLVKLRNNLENLEIEKDFNNYNKKTTDLVRVCISIGLRIGKILEEKCKEFDEKCIILNKYSLSCNWFTYWNENFPKSNSLSNDIEEFNIIEENNDINRNMDLRESDESHICTINCVKYEKCISDFKMLSKVANHLFHKSFMLSIWSSKNDFSKINYQNSDKTNTYKINDNNINQNDQFNDYFIDLQDYFENDMEELNESLSNLEDILLPEIVCSSIHEIKLNDSILDDESISLQFVQKDNHIKNNSRRGSIIVENIDYESLIECRNKVSTLKKSMIKMRELQTEIYRLIIESTGEIDYLEEQTALAQMNSAQGACCVAQGCKTKSKWWPFQGSTAGLLCGGAAGLFLGPLGISIGAAVGGALGLTFGNILKTQCEIRMDNILKECEIRSLKTNKIINYKKQEHKRNKSNEDFYELLVEIKDTTEVEKKNNIVLVDNYNKYISKVTLNDILENIDIIP